jgi:hypothetical protein
MRQPNHLTSIDKTADLIIVELVENLTGENNQNLLILKKDITHVFEKRHKFMLEKVIYM